MVDQKGILGRKRVSGLGIRRIDGKSFRVVEYWDKNDALLMIRARAMLITHPRYRPSLLARACRGGEPRVTTRPPHDGIGNSPE